MMIQFDPVTVNGYLEFNLLIYQQKFLLHMP